MAAMIKKLENFSKEGRSNGPCGLSQELKLKFLVKWQLNYKTLESLDVFFSSSRCIHVLDKVFHHVFLFF